MIFCNRKKQVVVATLFGLMVMLQSFVPQGTTIEPQDKAKNLQVIYPDISHHDLMAQMKDISRSLGVECNYCHVATKESNGTEKPVLDFASDAKKEKLTAREMMIMTAAINTDYISKLTSDNKKTLITCVTCHRGQVKPVVNVDSLSH